MDSLRSKLPQGSYLSGSVKKDDAAEVLLIEGHEVRVSNPGKLYFSRQTKLSKLDIVQYYLSVAGLAHSLESGTAPWFSSGSSTARRVRRFIRSGRRRNGRRGCER